MRIKPTNVTIKQVNDHRKWLSVGVATMAMSWTFLIGSNQVQAATDPTPNPADTTQQNTQAEQLQQDSVPLSGEPTSITENESDANSVGSATSATNSTASASNSADSSAAGSANSEAAKSVASEAPAAPSNEPQSVASEATSADSVVTSGNEDQTAKPAVSSPAVSARGSFRVQAPAVKAPAKAKVDQSTFADSDVVTIEDSQLLAAVKAGLGVSDDADLTYGDIRHTSKKEVVVQADNSTNMIAELTGIDALSELPATTLLELRVNIQAATVNSQNQVVGTDFDLTPLENLHLIELDLYTDYFSKVDLTPLKEIGVTDLKYVSLNSLDPFHNPYQLNLNGMTNAQLAQIADWLTLFLNRGKDYQVPGYTNFRQVNLDGNCLTDFSVFSGVETDANVKISAYNETYISPITMNIVTGQPITFTATEQIGINGEYLQSPATKSYSLPATVNAAGEVAWDSVTDLGDGEYRINAPVQTGNYFAYGQWGYAAKPYRDQDYFFDVYYGSSQRSLNLMTDAMIYRQTNWQTDPSIQVNYIDKTTGDVLKAPEQLGVGKKLGETVDLTPYTTLADYDYAGSDAESLTATYTADPQVINLYFTKTPTQVAAGDVKVVYADTDGNVLGTDMATYPDGQWVGETYTTTQKTFDGYTFKSVDTNGLAATGQLTTEGGTVTYLYQKDAVAPVEDGQVTVVYMDDTTGQILTSQVLTGAIGTTSDYQTQATIKQYRDRGYELVNDEFPSTGVTFDAQAPTYTVHLKHQLVTVTDQKTVTQTIHYVYADKTTAAADYTATVDFKRQGQRDLVTWVMTWQAWTADQTSFPAKPSPVIAGYQADQVTVAAINGVTAASDDVTVTVTYTAVTEPETPDPDNPDPEIPDNPDPEVPVEPETPVEPDPEVPTEPETPVEPDPEVPTEPATPENPGQGDTINPDFPTAVPEADGPAETTTTPQATTPTNPVTTTTAQAAQILPVVQPTQLVANPTRPAKGQPATTNATTTKLPQTNDNKQSRWGIFGSCLLVLLGLVGYRRHEH